MRIGPCPRCARRHGAPRSREARAGARGPRPRPPLRPARRARRARRRRGRCVRRLSHCAPGAISRGRRCTRSCARRVLRLPPRRRWSPGSLRAVSSTTGVSRKTTSTGTRSADRARSASPPSSAGTGCRMPWWMRRSRAGRIGARSQAARGAPSSAGSPRRAGRTRRDRRVFCSIVAFRRIIFARLRAPSWIRTEIPLNKPSYMSAAQVRSAFLDFFRARGHVIVPSSSLVPGNDPTLLFTNAGMVQFKDVFLGRERRDYLRATSSQRCVRAGGKHNDLENVGYTARHHTFFEMLGNFSFGEYFKREAIHFAWEFLTRTLGLDPARLWCTVYRDDDEAADVWLKDVGVSPQRFARLGEASNFWAMGDTGPCGPCSEIFYDHGPGIPGGPPGTADADGDRYIEIWNLVFMQYNRDEQGTMQPLPKPSVDTGMGLERIAAVLQGKHSNYEIDLFQDLIRAAAREVWDERRGAQELKTPSLNVIADHIRACAFLIVDGVIPGNEGRGYVLRRIIRRAIRHGYKLGQKRPFFFTLVPELAGLMGDAYPELPLKQDYVMHVLKIEEERFAETLEHGMKVLEGALHREDRMLDGETVFQLYDTFGFPVDLTADMARERGIMIDHAGFEAAMQRQRERARAASKFSMQSSVDYSGRATEFHGYDTLALDDAKVEALYREGTSVPAIAAGEAAIVVLDKTPFYAESGGQVGDAGEIVAPGGTFVVSDTQKIQSEVFGHHGALATGRLAVGDKVVARVDAQRRARTMRNHSATHLMHG